MAWTNTHYQNPSPQEREMGRPYATHGTSSRRGCWRCTTEILFRIGSIPALGLEKAHLVLDGLDLRKILRLGGLLEIKDVLKLREHEGLEVALLAQLVVVDDHVLETPGRRPLFPLGEDHDVEDHGHGVMVRARPELVIDRNAVRPGHGELEIDGDALEDQSDSAVGEQVLPRRFMPRVEVLSDVARPVAAPGLGEPYVHDVVDVAHRVLLPPHDRLSVQPGSFLFSQIALAAGDQVAPVAAEYLQRLAR